MPPPQPWLTIRAIRPLVSGLRGCGHDPGPMLSAAGIDAARLDDPDARVPMSVGAALLMHAATQTGDGDLGLHVAEHADSGSFDVHFYAMASSATLGEAYERLCRYQRLIHETSRVDLETHGDAAVLRHQLAGGVAAPRQTAEFLLAAWVRAGRLVTGVDWTPRAVHFAHAAPDDGREQTRFFGIRPLFATGENAIVLDSRLLELPSARADAALAAMLDRYAADRVDQAPRSSSVADRMRAVLAGALSGGEPTATRLASRLKMSVRSLHRLLAAEGTTYRAVLDSLRRELATRHLSGDQASIAEIGFLLGFAELSSFHRAFKRWTGTTPAEFRARHRR